MQTTTQHTMIPATTDSPELEAVTFDGVGTRAVVAPPHPLYGGSIAIPAVGAIFDALADAGLSPTAFNWRGVGASSGRASGEIPDAVADYRAVLRHTAGGGPVVACGYSWGAAAALMVAAETNAVEQLILVAPPVAMIEDGSIFDSGRPMHIVAGSDDMFAPRELLEQTIGPIAGATLDIIEGADHFFSTGGVDQVHALIRSRL